MKSPIRNSDSILRRNELCGFLLSSAGDSVSLAISRPIENKFHPLTAPNLVKFLFFLHQRRGWDPPRDFCSYLREAKLLVKTYPEEVLEKALVRACHCSRHPFGFNFVRNFLG